MKKYTKKQKIAMKNLSMVPEAIEFEDSETSEVMPRYTNIVHELT